MVAGVRHLDVADKEHTALAERGVLRGRRVTLRPLEPPDLDWILALLNEPGVRRWWGPYDADRVRAEFLEDAQVLAFVVEVAGEVVGVIECWEVSDPDYSSVSLDIALTAGSQSRGLGPESMRLILAWLFTTRGHHRATIDPAVANERAIRAYRKVGFRPVGIMREYERGADGWHDNLLMDILSGEIT